MGLLNPFGEDENGDIRVMKRRKVVKNILFYQSKNNFHLCIILNLIKC